MKAKKIYNAPKCKPIEIDNETLLMVSGGDSDQPGRVEEDEVQLNKTELFNVSTHGVWD